MTTIAIQFDCVTRAFTRCAAVFPAFLGWTRANCILTLVVVCHWEPPEKVSIIRAPRVAEKFRMSNCGIDSPSLMTRSEKIQVPP